MAKMIRHPLSAATTLMGGLVGFYWILIGLSYFAAHDPTGRIVQFVFYSFFLIPGVVAAAAVAIWGTVSTPQRTPNHKGHYTGRYDYDNPDPEPRAIRAKIPMFVIGWVAFPAAVTLLVPATTVGPYIIASAFAAAAGSWSLAFDQNRTLTRVAFYLSLVVVVLAGAWEALLYYLPGRAGAVQTGFATFDRTGGFPVWLLVAPLIIGVLWTARKLLGDELTKKVFVTLIVLAVAGALFYGAGAGIASFARTATSSAPTTTGASINNPVLHPQENQIMAEAKRDPSRIDARLSRGVSVTSISIPNGAQVEVTISGQWVYWPEKGSITATGDPSDRGPAIGNLNGGQAVMAVGNVIYPLQDGQNRISVTTGGSPRFYMGGCFNFADNSGSLQITRLTVNGMDVTQQLRQPIP